MKVMQYINSNPPVTTLQNVVDKLINALLPVAARNKSSIVNDIPADLSIRGDGNTIVSVISGLLRSVINNARESCIRISAKEMYGRMVTVSVKDSNSFDTYAVACGLQDVVALAKKIGGDLDITNPQQKVTTIAFNFPIDQQEQNHPLLS
jgi:hypothetical protein